jgi:hypothetical protein
MTTKIPLTIIAQISASNVTNNSTVTGATIKDAVEQLDSDKGNVDVFDYSQAGDPATDTNPAGVGASWINETSGEIFVCTDNTAGSNVWEGTAGSIVQPVFQGTNFGYISGGNLGGPSTAQNVIDKFPFASDANATDVGDLFQSRLSPAGQSSTNNGYSSGGDTVGGTTGTSVNTVDKFPFASDASATDVGDLTQARREVGGQSSTDNGYSSGGQIVGTTTNSNVIDKFPFASDTNATDVGDMTTIRDGVTGQSSTDNGYSTGGVATTTRLNIIDKFPFASDTNATDVGDLTVAKRHTAGQSSTTHGYASGGADISVRLNVIEKFSFASDGNASDVGDLTVIRTAVSGQSSTTHGYTSGGDDTAMSNVIDKFDYTNETTASDVGDLTVARQYTAGQQY